MVLLWARTLWVKAGLPMRSTSETIRHSGLVVRERIRAKVGPINMAYSNMTATAHASPIRPSPHCIHLIHWSFSWVSRVITWIAFPTAVVDQLPGEVRAIPAISPSPKTLVCLINRKNYQLSEASVNRLTAKRLKVKLKGKTFCKILINKLTAIKTKRTRRYLSSGSTLQQRKAIL